MGGITDQETYFSQRQRIATWVAVHILPHEQGVRRWLERRCATSDEADEIIQEAYCRLAALQSVDHIERPTAYFFSVVRSLLLRQIKRSRIVQIEAIAEIESFSDDSPSPERIIGGRRDFAWIMSLIDAMPERRSRVVKLRKLEGWPQKKIAQHLGMTEKAVEKQIWLGICALRAAWSEGEALMDDGDASSHAGRAG